MAWHNDRRHRGISSPPIILADYGNALIGQGISGASATGHGAANSATASPIEIDGTGRVALGTRHIQ